MPSTTHTIQGTHIAQNNKRLLIHKVGEMDHWPCNIRWTVSHIGYGGVQSKCLRNTNALLPCKYISPMRHKCILWSLIGLIAIPLPLPLPLTSPSTAPNTPHPPYRWEQPNASQNAGQSILGLWLWLTLKLGLGLWLGLWLSLVPAGNHMAYGHGMGMHGTHQRKLCLWMIPCPIQSAIHIERDS